MSRHSRLKRCPLEVEELEPLCLPSTMHPMPAHHEGGPGRHDHDWHRHDGPERQGPAAPEQVRAPAPEQRNAPRADPLAAAPARVERPALVPQALSAIAAAPVAARPEAVREVFRLFAAGDRAVLQLPVRVSLEANNTLAIASADAAIVSLPSGRTSPTPPQETSPGHRTAEPTPSEVRPHRSLTILPTSGFGLLTALPVLAGAELEEAVLEFLQGGTALVPGPSEPGQRSWAPWVVLLATLAAAGEAARLLLQPPPVLKAPDGPDGLPGDFPGVS